MPMSLVLNFHQKSILLITFIRICQMIVCYTFMHKKKYHAFSYLDESLLTFHFYVLTFVNILSWISCSCFHSLSLESFLYSLSLSVYFLHLISYYFLRIFSAITSSVLLFITRLSSEVYLSLPSFSYSNSSQR